VFPLRYELKIYMLCRRKKAVSDAGIRPKSDCSGKAQKQLYSNLQTRPLVIEGATNLQSSECLKEISRRKINWSQVPDGRLTPRQTGQLTVGRKLTHSLDRLFDLGWILLFVGDTVEGALHREDEVTVKQRN
jgi:hypothetical protein